MPAPYRPPIAVRQRQLLNKAKTRGIMYDFVNYSTLDMVKWFDDFLGNTTTALATVEPRYTAGGAGTAATYAQGLGGTVNLAANNNGSTLYLDNKNFLADNNCTITVRWKLAAFTAVKIEVGFVSTNATATLGATGQGLITAGYGSTPVVNTAAADGACIIADTSGTLGTNPTFYHIIGSVAGVTKLFTPTGALVAALELPVANTYQNVTLQLRRVAIASEDVDAEGWINGVSLGVMRGGACTFNTAMYPYVSLWSTTASSKTLTLDAFEVYQQRDMTN